VLFNITGGMDMTLFEVNEAADIISQAAHPDANIIFGAVQDASFDGRVKITVIATGFDSGIARPQSIQYAPSRPNSGYDRSNLYTIGGSSGSAAPPRASQSQGYNNAPVTPAAHISRHPTGPLPGERPVPAARVQPPVPVQPLAQPARPQTPPLAREPLPIAGRDPDEEDSFGLDDDAIDLEDSLNGLPVPEPEAQPLQRPGGPQRHVRRLDRGAAADLTRGNRNNTPSGDAIDIPAFLRKR
jgi:cell division protein FtsZ